MRNDTYTYGSLQHVQITTPTEQRNIPLRRRHRTACGVRPKPSANAACAFSTSRGESCAPRFEKTWRTGCNNVCPCPANLRLPPTRQAQIPPVSSNHREPGQYPCCVSFEQ